MHAYRDALDAESVWILYPGRGVGIKHFSPHTGSSSAAAGVGAIPLTPGQQGQRRNLRTNVAELVAGG
jgi:predicted component of viral defense system (DUF524 family)